MYLLWIMAGFLILYVYRLVKGPSVWDRLLGVNLIATKIVIIVTVFASLFERTFLLDMAIMCALLGFIGIIFISQFLLDRAKAQKETDLKTRGE